MSIFNRFEHLLEGELPNFPVDPNNYLVIHGDVVEMFNTQQLVEIDLDYDSKDAKKIIAIEYYMKRRASADYHGSLYIKKSVKGNEVYRKLLFMFLKKMEQAREDEDIKLNAGIEIKKTFLFRTDFLNVWRSKLNAERILNMNFTRGIEVSPVIVTRRVKCGGTKVEILSNVIYEFDPEFPLLSKRRTQR